MQHQKKRLQDKRTFGSGHLLEEDNTVLGHLKLGVNRLIQGHGKGNVVDGLGCFLKSLSIGRVGILQKESQISHIHDVVRSTLEPLGP